MLEPRLTVDELDALLERMDEDTDEDREDDLAAFFERAWPTLRSQVS